MKEIKAYLHKHRVADVIQALTDAALYAASSAPACRNVSIVPVESLLKPVDNAEQHYSMDLEQPVIHEVKLELLCDEPVVDQVVALIERHGRTGQEVAGWIIVADLIQAISISGPLQPPSAG